MGQASSQSHGGGDEQFRALHESTGLSESQLRAVQKGFRKAGKGPTVSRAEFLEVLRTGGISGKVLSGQMWRLVAGGEKESVSFEEFAGAVGRVSRGSAEQRVEVAFRLLDVDGDGSIGKAELCDVLGEVQAMCGQLVGYSGRVFANPTEFADVFFAEFDPEKTGKISRLAYEQGAYKSLDLISTLNLYGSAAPVQEATQLSSPVEYGPRLPDSVII